MIGVPQYASTVAGSSPNPPYNPAQDCQGYFTSYLYQPNNNCYAYGADIATNTFPQPGRYSGCLITQATLDGSTVSSYAVKDGLILVGQTIQDCLDYQQQHMQNGQLNGHFVALMISPPGDVNWPGDYHWARCNNSAEACNSWSQKDGNDQITDFDFAGNVITDPSAANWTVNQGPLTPSSAPATTPAPPGHAGGGGHLQLLLLHVRPLRIGQHHLRGSLALRDAGMSRSAPRNPTLYPPTRTDRHRRRIAEERSAEAGMPPHAVTAGGQGQRPHAAPCSR